MDFDPRSVLWGLVLLAAVLYGMWRNFRPGATPPSRRETEIVTAVAVVLVIGLFLWPILDP